MVEKREVPNDAVDWRPEFTGDALDHYRKIRVETDPGILTLKALRDRLGLTQREMAEVLGFTQSNVSKIEAKGDPSLSVLRRMIEGKGGKLKLIVEMGDGEPFEIAA